MSDHHAHELWHGTPFRTWFNELFHHLNGFMTLHEGYAWRWSHTRHHTETLIVGRDPEIAAPRPPDIRGLLLDLFYIKSAYIQLKKIGANAIGFFDSDTRDFVPESELGKVALSSRIYITVILAMLAACVYWDRDDSARALCCDAAHLWGADGPDLQHHPACGACGKCSRSSAQYANGDLQSGLRLDVHEYELPH